MDGDDQLTDAAFRAWLKELATQAGYNPDAYGRVSALARASGTDRTQIGRFFSGAAGPTITLLRAWVKTFKDAGVNVELRDVLIKAGILLPEDIPSPDEPTPPPVEELDLYAVARAYGIPDDRASLFVASVQAVANTFADEPEGTSISEPSQTGRLSARR